MAIKKTRVITCPYCGKTLMKAKYGEIEIKCSKNNTARKGCGRVIKFEITDKSVKHTVIRE